MSHNFKTARNLKEPAVPSVTYAVLADLKSY
jgi:hypothetical protein